MEGYSLGIDLGTTFTAASVHDGQRPDVVTLGSTSLGIPSIVHVGADGIDRIGEEALAPAREDPTRLVYEFKRHIGSDADLLLPDGAFPPTHFSTLVLRWVVSRVVQRMHDEPPASVAVTHPAHWNAHQLARHRQVLRDAGVPDSVAVSEPEAAAISYATRAPVAPGDVVAVYDLGGGTFDTAVVQRRDDGFAILGRPGGIGHLGGADFDKVVFALIDDHLDGAISQLDPDDPEVVVDLHVLAEECTRAKEQLSSNTHVTVPVRVGPVKQSVRITRAELEQALRPRIAETVTTLLDAVRSADLHPSDVSRVLLVGGSSRIPLVRAMVEQAVPAPVSDDADPVAAVATGAAIVARLHLEGRPGQVPVPAMPGPPAEVGGEVGAAGAPHVGAAEAGSGTTSTGRDAVARLRAGMVPLEPLAGAATGPTLRVADPTGTVHVLAPGTVLRVGRSADNDVVLADDVVSRHHGRFQWEGGAWRFTDPGSSNGTYLDGEPLPKPRRFRRDPLRTAALPARGVLRLGRSGPELRVTVEAAGVPGPDGLRLRCGGRAMAPHGTGTFVVGRSATADLVVDDPTRRVSATHLQLRPSGSGWLVFDVSANGTYVDDSPVGVDPVPLEAGLQLRLGAPDGPLVTVEDPTTDAGDERDDGDGRTITVHHERG